MSLDRTIIPAQNPIEAPKYLNAEVRRLKNNTKLHLFSKEDELLSSVTLKFNGGFTSTKNGLDLGLLKNLILSETKNYPNASLNEELDFYGAYFQVVPNFENVEIQVICLNRYLPEVLELVKEIITNAKFVESDFKTEVEKKKQHFEVSKKKVSYLGKQALQNALFGDKHIYGKQREVEDYENISLEDVSNLYNGLIKNKPFELFLTGKFTQEDIELCERLLIPENPDEIQNLRLNNTIVHKTNVDNVVVDEAMQSYVSVGFSCPNSSHPDYLKWKVVNTILGGYFGSRLMKNIREDKGYTYGIGSQLLHRKDSGMFKISTEVGSEHVEDTLRQINKEINLMKTELISEDELNLVKNYLLGSVLQSSDGIMQQAAMYKNLYYQGFSWERMETFISTIKNITASEILALSKTFFEENQFVQIVAGVKYEVEKK
ncbi:MAG: M16 family metallopeptidase [Flavobacteriales bacterium]